jgi:small subunit ribosomal protein S10
MSNGRIRVRLKSYDSRVIDTSDQQILDMAIRTGTKIVGLILLPTQRRAYTSNKSLFADKNARKHFENSICKRFIDIISPTEKTMGSLSHLKLLTSIQVEIKM